MSWGTLHEQQDPAGSISLRPAIPVYGLFLPRVDCGMLGAWWTAEELEGPGVIEVLYRKNWRKSRRMSVRIQGVLAQIRTEDIPNLSLKLHRFVRFNVTLHVHNIIIISEVWEPQGGEYEVYSLLGDGDIIVSEEPTTSLFRSSTVGIFCRRLYSWQTEQVWIL